MRKPKMIIYSNKVNDRQLIAIASGSYWGLVALVSYGPANLKLKFIFGQIILDI